MAYNARIRPACTLCILTWKLTLCMLGIFSCFCCLLLTFIKINFFKKFFQEHFQSIKQFTSSDVGPHQLSGSKLFAKVIIRRLLPSARKEFQPILYANILKVFSVKLHAFLEVKNHNNLVSVSSTRYFSTWDESPRRTWSGSELFDLKRSVFFLQKKKDQQMTNVLKNYPACKEYFLHFCSNHHWDIWANSADPDQTPQNAASDQGLYCLLIDCSYQDWNNQQLVKICYL